MNILIEIILLPPGLGQFWNVPVTFTKYNDTDLPEGAIMMMQLAIIASCGPIFSYLNTHAFLTLTIALYSVYILICRLCVSVVRIKTSVS